tara:strand:+ start:926 stop:2230 length:1305 start_codon:yes stop_codon:yes gene_type:complete
LAKKILNKEKFWNLINYKPIPNQVAVHNSKARFRINIQGRRSGKSFGAAREIEPWILSPNTRGWICAPNYELCDKIARIVKEDLILKLKLPLASKKEINGQIYYFKVAGLNSEVWIKSADNADSLVGEGLDWLVIDEAAKIKKIIWEQYLRPTLSDRAGWVLMTTTPEGHNFMFDLYMRGKDKNFPDWESWQHPSWESPYFKDNIDDLKKTLTKETWEQEYGASFVSFTGRVLPFSRHTNVIKGLRFNPNLPVFCSIDFGFRMPAVGWYQVEKKEGRDTVFQIDEICFEENIKTDQLADMILRKNYPVETYYGDPAGGGVQAQSGLGDIEQFRRKGIFVRYKTDKVSRNIANGVSHFRSFVEDANGDSHFFVSDKCKGSIDCYENYRYPEHRQDQRLKEEPLKDGRLDHMNDATRYFLVNRFPIKRRTAGVIEW